MMACQAWSKCALNLQCLSSTLKMHSSHLTCGANERAQSCVRLEGWAGEAKAIFYFIIIRSETGPRPRPFTKWSGDGDQPPLLALDFSHLCESKTETSWTPQHVSVWYVCHSALLAVLRSDRSAVLCHPPCQAEEHSQHSLLLHGRVCLREVSPS